MSDAELRRNLWDRAANTWRRLVDTATVAWDTSTPGQASASVPNGSIDTDQLADDAVTADKIAPGAIPTPDAADIAYDNGTSGLAATDVQAAIDEVAGRPAVIVSRAYAQYTANADLSTTIPIDDTIPQNNEGTEIVTAQITPSSTSNRVRVTFTGFVSGNDTAIFATTALFRDSTANALYATCISVQDDQGGGVTIGLRSIISFIFEHVPATTSTITYKIRVGPDGGVIRFNGSTAARRFGGVAAAALILEEITP